MTSSAGPVPPTFRALFCRRHGCSDAAFERQVVGRCFPAYSRALGRLLLALRPAMFQREMAMVGRLGRTTNESVVRGELDGYAYENQRDKSFRARRLGLRLSRRLFIRVFREVLPVQAAGGLDPSVPVTHSALPPEASVSPPAPSTK